ncbi:hypothetical protein [Marinirhabdus gelatinilytica]|uniref:Uncharacterized protein n=1 Tax=Marinirhabdus gelatinilytica TaxID=1703343 RepID=A0A370QAH6_9FLAO|nr:hypothetical protein [Marinirhabdus gelatinilytica]RDK85378.1 hypothetical protein C8D94_103203 [Marinirhabdus gelatinilytica]
MKNTISFLCVAVLFSATLTAQVQKDVQKKTTVKKVRVTDDENVTTKVVEDVDAEIDVIEVEGNDMQDQAKKVKKLDADRTQVVQSTTDENAANKMVVKQKKQAQQMDLEKSKEMMAQRAREEKMAMEQKKKEMMAELEKRRKELESRPKGMAKLKKDPDGDGIQ